MVILFAKTFYQPEVLISKIRVLLLKEINISIRLLVDNLGIIGQVNLIKVNTPFTLREYYHLQYYCHI